MILGTGIDIIDIRRIKKTLDRFGDKFKKRCFSNIEIERSDRKLRPENSYAKRYAAKEACAKALGTGIARGIFWRDIAIENNFYGKPNIKLYGNALKFLSKISKKKLSLEVSLSDEANYAIAEVIIYLKK